MVSNGLPRVAPRVARSSRPWAKGWNPFGIQRLILRTFRRLDELPELRVFLQGLVFAHLDAGTEEEILERVLAQDAVDEDAELVAFEIDAVIADAEAVQDMAVAFELAEIVEFAGDDVGRQAAKIAEDLELQLLGH